MYKLIHIFAITSAFLGCADPSMSTTVSGKVDTVAIADTDFIGLTMSEFRDDAEDPLSTYINIDFPFVANGPLQISFDIATTLKDLPIDAVLETTALEDDIVRIEITGVRESVESRGHAFIRDGEVIDTLVELSGTIVQSNRGEGKKAMKAKLTFESDDSIDIIIQLDDIAAAANQDG